MSVTPEQILEAGELAVRAMRDLTAELDAAYERACADDPGLAAEVEWELRHGTRGWLDVAADRELRREVRG